MGLSHSHCKINGEGGLTVCILCFKDFDEGAAENGGDLDRLFTVPCCGGFIHENCFIEWVQRNPPACGCPNCFQSPLTVLRGRWLVPNSTANRMPCRFPGGSGGFGPTNRPSSLQRGQPINLRQRRLLNLSRHQDGIVQSQLPSVEELQQDPCRVDEKSQFENQEEVIKNSQEVEHAQSQVVGPLQTGGVPIGGTHQQRPSGQMNQSKDLGHASSEIEDKPEPTPTHDRLMQLLGGLSAAAILYIVVFLIDLFSP